MTYEAFAEGVARNKLRVQPDENFLGDPKKKVFDMYAESDGSGLSFKGFITMLIRQKMSTLVCSSCLTHIRTEFATLFNYLDVDGDNLASADEVKLRLGEFDDKKEVGTPLINHFILVNDKDNKAGLTQEEFIEGMLLGFTEVMLVTDGVDPEYETKLAERVRKITSCQALK